MNSRLLIPIFVAIALGLVGCEKSQETTEQQAKPETGAAQEEKASEQEATKEQ
jgi:hypothetical protein